MKLFSLTFFMAFISMSAYGQSFQNIVCKGSGEWKGVTGTVQTYTVNTKVESNVMSSTFVINGLSETLQFRAEFKENGFFDVIIDEGGSPRIIGNGFCHDIQCIYKASFPTFAIEESLLFVHRKLYRLARRISSEGAIMILQDVCIK